MRLFNNILKVISLNKKKYKEFTYEFIPYKKIGDLELDKTIPLSEFKTKSIPYLYENGLNHVLCRPLHLDNPDVIKRKANNESLYLIIDNKKIKITCYFDKLIEDLKSFCDDIIIIEGNDDIWKEAYSKRLGILIAANKYNGFYLIQSIRFVSKEVFDDIIKEENRRNKK